MDSWGGRQEDHGFNQVREPLIARVRIRQYSGNKSFDAAKDHVQICTVRSSNGSEESGRDKTLTRCTPFGRLLQ